MSLEIPQHIAIIMDGNGRWAQKRGYPRVYGHVRGSSRVRGIVEEANRLGVKALTLYAFSTENWARPEGERHVLWKLLKKYLARDTEDLHRKNVRLRVIGEFNRLDPDVRGVLEQAIARTAQNTGLQLTFALSYGAKAELAQAARLFAKDCLAGVSSPQAMDESLMEKYLWTADLGPLSKVDLFIRTSGENRISNFLLWQAAYAEFVFTDVCWPDYGPENLLAAVKEYSARDRRYGGLSVKQPAMKSR